MAHASTTLAPETTRTHASGQSAAGFKETPIEERTDVTVHELEKRDLPFPAELYHGRIVYKMPNFAHGVIQNNIGAEIRDYLKKNPIGLVSGDANFRIWPERARESRAPDVSFIAKERLPKDLNRYLPMVPDLAVEILSPEDSFSRMMEKVDDYLQNGVKLVWIVISSTREVLVCTTEGKSTVNDKLTAPEILPDFELPLTAIFEGLNPEEAES